MADERRGELPTSGATRPGPVGWDGTIRAAAVPVRPVAIRIPSIQVDTEVERRPIVNGLMADPTGPFVVAWYGATSRLGVPGNVVMAGHVDYAGVGPAVFARVGELQPDDLIEVTGEDVKVYQFHVTWTKLVDAENPPLDEIVGETQVESLTLITCGGDFNYSTQRYLQRLIVRAERH
jgi:LPXTG-site transpeptidase (sortase) family protein